VVKKAQEDEIAAACLLKEKTSFSVICFLSQQVVEKSLKAFLAYYDKDIPKIYEIN
jgi:HEPN domain-containing protein